MMPRSAVVLALCLAAAAPAPAHAATVGVDANCWKDDCLETVHFVAAPGERNHVTISQDSEFVVTIADTGAPLTVEDQCVALSKHAARCSADAGAFDRLYTKLWLGDGDDTAQVGSDTAYGGPGDDRLFAVDGHLTGGPGSDVLTATGAAAFRDGDGAHPARDVYRGAHAGVSYAGRRRGLRIDLRAGRAGEDVLQGIRSAVGTAHADTIIGTPGRDRLDGHGGHDRILGLGGDDRIELDGNEPVVRTPRRATVRCGAGQDSVHGLGGGTFVDGCETLELQKTYETVRLHQRPAGAVLTDIGCHCVRSLDVARADGVVVGQAEGRPRTLRLNARGRQLLAARGRLAVTVELRERSDYGLDVDRFRTVLTRPRP